MHLLTVTHFYESHGGGIERVAGQLCRHLAAMGHRCEWAASASDTPPDAPGVTALLLPCVNPTERLTGLPMPIPGPRGFARLVRAIGQADGVIIHDALYITSIVAMLTARLRRKPVVLIQHIAELPFGSAVMRAVMSLATALITRPMLRSATGVVFISDAVRQAFADVALRQPAKLLFNGIDTETFHKVAGPGEAQTFRDRYGVPQGGPLAVFVGRFVPKKGLAVIRELARQRPGTTFALAGSGPVDPAGWGLPNVRTLGSLPAGEVASLLRTADVMLLPSVGEGYPLVVQEALACGLPVICGLDSATADPGATCFLQGVTIDHADPEGTARRIFPLLDNNATNEVKRNCAAAYAAETYSWSAMAAGIVNQLGLPTIWHPAGAAASS